MKRRYVTSFLAICFAVIVGTSVEAQKPDDKEQAPMAEIGKAAPDFTLTDATGAKHKLSDFKGKYVVLEWVNFDCPFVKKHYGAGNMQTLQAAFKLKDVKWLSICSSAPGKQGYFEGEELTKRIFEESWQASAYLVDSDGKVGRMYGAKTTPHMFIVDPKGMLVYAGGIDDKPTPNPDDIKIADNYVRDALNSALKGKEIAVKASAPYGCSVKY